MPEIHFTVRDRIAEAEGDPEIVCGNSDYTAVFDFDAEWTAFPVRTMRTVWRENGSGRFFHEDTLFTGNTAPLPPVWRTCQISVGVYAGDIRTTTPARVPCAGCITDPAPHHADPDDALYRQLLDHMTAIARNGRPEFAVMLTAGVPLNHVPECIGEPS